MNKVRKYKCADYVYEEFKKKSHVRLTGKVLAHGTYLVPSYKVGDNGRVECVPIPESQRKHIVDGKSCELVNLMLGKLPEDLAQVNMFDQMTSAEKVTSECVRRFGKLSEQREALSAKLKSRVTPKTIEE